MIRRGGGRDGDCLCGSSAILREVMRSCGEVGTWLEQQVRRPWSFFSSKSPIQSPNETTYIYIYIYH